MRDRLPVAHTISSSDGRFLMIKENATPDGRATPASITVVQSWFEELKRMVPAK